MGANNSLLHHLAHLLVTGMEASGARVFAEASKNCLSVRATQYILESLSVYVYSFILLYERFFKMSDHKIQNKSPILPSCCLLLKKLDKW